ncbi:MAG: hypothetical protein R6U16_01745 [Desulfotignum sp.]|jgi:hypothetical protein
MNETVKKMVNNPSADNRRSRREDEYAQFSWNIHEEHILSGHDGVKAGMLPGHNPMLIQ